MKYSKEDRMAIGKEVYEKRLSINAASLKYDLNQYTVRDYYRQYKAHAEESEAVHVKYGSYAGLSKEELIEEIISLRVKLLFTEGKKPVQIVHELKDEFPIARVCEEAGITRAWYYTWLKKESST